MSEEAISVNPRAEGEVRLREALNSAVESGVYLSEGEAFYHSITRAIPQPAGQSRTVYLEPFMALCQQWQRCRVEALKHRKIGDELGAAMLEAEQSSAYSAIRRCLNVAGPVPLELLRVMNELNGGDYDAVAVAEYLAEEGYDVR